MIQKFTTFLFLSLFTTSAYAQIQPLPDFVQLPGAPATGSAEDQSDYAQNLSLQNSRTPDDCARAATEVKITLASFFGSPFGPLSDQEVSRYNQLFESLYLEANGYISITKQQWQRPRPYIAHPDLKPCIKLESSFSYPSGHSALAEFYARALIVLFPDRADVLKARAKQIALDRNIGGVHYPSDIRDGNLLGDQIFDHEDQTGDLTRKILSF